MFMKSWKVLSICFLSLILIIGQPVLANSEDEGIVVRDMEHLTKENLVESLLGEGVTVTNISLTGVDVSSGFFTGGEDIIGFDQGVILSTGSVHNVKGPNTSDGISFETGLPGDPDLDELIPGYETYDATVLEFEFIPENDVIYFQYVFASDEYNEYVNSEYNDVFGFFINGENEAKLPGTDIVVSINNVNGGNPYGNDNASNPEYYRNNDIVSGAPINTEMDGLTVVLSVEAQVNAGEVNTIKMAIADAGDRILDSNVFIKAGSFTDRPEDPEPEDPPKEEEPEEPENPLEFGECITDCEPAEQLLTIAPICTEKEGVNAWVITNPNDEEIEVKWGTEYPGVIIDYKVIGPGETIIKTAKTEGDTITLEFPLLNQQQDDKEENDTGDETNQENGDSSDNEGNDEDEQSGSDEGSNSNDSDIDTNEDKTSNENNSDNDTNVENTDSQTNDAPSSENEEGTVEEEEEHLYELVQITASTNDIDCEPSKPEEPKAPEEEDEEEEQPAPPVEKPKQETPKDREEKPKTIDGGKLPRTSSPWYNILAMSTLGFILSGFFIVRRVKQRIY